MKATRFHQYGGADVLQYEDVEVPQPGNGEVLVRVAASGFNPVDAGIRGGWVRDAFPIRLPHVPGFDMAGTVETLGDQVTGVQVGDAVLAFLPMTADGAAAQFVLTSAADLVAAPGRVPLADSAALPSTGTTAWQALFGAADVRAGRRVLINGAGGTVGGLATQLAADAGAHVIAISRPSSIERLRGWGTEQVLDHTAGPIAVDEPVDVLLNLGAITPEALHHLTGQVRPGGIVVNTVPSLPTPGDPDRGVRGVPFFVHSDTAVLQRLVRLVDEGELELDIAERAPLHELPDVHARSDAGRLRGKVIVLPPHD